MTRKFVFVHDDARKNAADYAMYHCPVGWQCVFSEPKKRRIQEEKYHAMISDIARQTKYIGHTWSDLHMKRILIDEFADEMRLSGTPLSHDSQIVPSENGKRIIQLEIHSSDFKVKEAAQFIEFLYAWGANRNVKWGLKKDGE